MIKIPALDYIRIVGIDEAASEHASISDVTFNIEHSQNSDFSTPNRGIITLRFSDLIDTEGMQRADIELIAGALIHEILIREKDDERAVLITHFLGLPLGEWLIQNSPLLRQ